MSTIATAKVEKTNWRALVEHSQASTYVLPEGWDARTKLADDLDCSEDQVRRLMAPLVKSKRVLVDIFPVWDHITKRVQRVTAYRQVPVKAAAGKG